MLCSVKNAHKVAGLKRSNQRCKKLIGTALTWEHKVLLLLCTLEHFHFLEFPKINTGSLQLHPCFVPCLCPGPQRELIFRRRQSLLSTQAITLAEPTRLSYLSSVLLLSCLAAPRRLEQVFPKDQVYSAESLPGPVGHIQQRHLALQFWKENQNGREVTVRNSNEQGLYNLVALHPLSAADKASLHAPLM